MKMIGSLIIVFGLAGYMKEWIFRNLSRGKRLEELLSFLRKAVYALEETHTTWIRFFEEYEGQEKCIVESVHEVAKRLKEHRYPKGELAWQEVMIEQKEAIDLSKEAFELVSHVGDAFFGRSQKENLESLRWYIKLLEKCKEQEGKAFIEKKKVWIPVGALGGVMIIIILI
jgi:stage III sporulation protein AB